MLSVIFFSCEKKASQNTKFINNEFHYDRMYQNNYRVISAFGFAEQAKLPDTSRRIIKDLLYDGLDYKNFTENQMKYHGDVFTELGKYKFDFDYQFLDNPEWEQLTEERWPEGATAPLFEYMLTFDNYSIASVHEEFTVYKYEWSIIPSDAAHGMYGTEYKTIDLKNRQISGLEDLLVPQTINNLDGRIRVLLHNQEIYPEANYPEKLPQPDNFLFEESGIRLFWQPYSIASYSFGIVSVLLPWAETEDYLTDDGRRLMKTVEIK